jgi:S-adenosylmethionine:tRNA ribosyltransferase-isomerase
MNDDFSLLSYDYTLPQENIAQHPCRQRDGSKLLVFDRAAGNDPDAAGDAIQHKQFSDILHYFGKDDILVLNDTKVFPARLQGRKETGGKVELFLLNFPRENGTNPTCPDQRIARAEALLKSSRKPPQGAAVPIDEELTCIIEKHLDSGHVAIRLEYPKHRSLLDILGNCGSVPLPPYIERASGTSENDRNRYQTVYARNTGAVAAPTAGLHFTEPILDTLRQRGVTITSLTLHVGYGTFAPVRTEAIKEHAIHSEFISIPQEAADSINTAKRRGGKVWAVGTTTVRALEYSGGNDGKVTSLDGWCDLYIIPGYSFKVIDNLITNFHLPKSSLLFLVSALCGRKQLLHCYDEAIAHNYRFYSYGDAMAILT